MKRLLDNNNKFFWPLLFAIFLIIVTLPYYLGGYIILGGEGNNFLDFSTHLSKYRDTWQNAGAGFITTSLGSTFSNVILLAFLQKFIKDIKIINFLIIFFIYFLPFLAMYFTSLTLKLPPKASFLVAFFYLVNPFTSYLLTSLNQWNIASFFVIPIFFSIIIRFYNENFKLFFISGLISLIFAFANTNPPMIIIIQASLLVSAILATYFVLGKIELKTLVKKYLTVLLAFFLFNIWWILHWFYVFSDATKMYTTGNALTWLEGEKYLLIMQKLLLLKWLIPESPDFSYLAAFFNKFPVQIVLLIPFSIIMLSFVAKKVKEKNFLTIFIFLLITGFLVKGARPPFGEAYVILVKLFPFFSILKTSTEKWGVLFIFLFTLLVIISIKSLKTSKIYRPSIKLLILYILVCSLPFINFNFIPDYKIEGTGNGSRKFKVKDSYLQLINRVNDDKENYRILSLPGSLNYQVALKTDRDKYYTGLDPIINNTDKPFITSYGSSHLANFDVLFDNVDSPIFKKLLSLFNINKILLNKDMYPWFGYAHNESVGQLENILSEDFSSEKFDSLFLYHNNEILPRFYIPTSLSFTKNGDVNNLPDLMNNYNFSPREAVFFPVKNLEFNKDQDNLFAVGEYDDISDNEIAESSRSFDALSYPYVNQKPNSLFYPLVLLREEWEERRLKNNPELLLDKKLFLAAKRINEIDKFFSENDPSILTTVLANYKTKMEKAIEIAMDKRQKKYLIPIKFHLYAHKEKVREMNLSTFTKQQIEKAFAAIEEQLIGAGAYRDFGKVAYNFDISKDNEYEILVKTDNLQGSLLEMSNGNKISSASSNNNWSNYGKYFFKTGTNNLFFIIPNLPNLIEEKELQKSQSIEYKDGEISLTLDNLFPSKSYIEDLNSLKQALKSAGGKYFLSDSQLIPVHYGIKEYSPNTIYRIQFDYFNDDSSLNVAVVQDNKKGEGMEEMTPFIQKKLPRTYGKFRHEDFLIKSQKKSQKGELYFYLSAEEKKISKATIKNVKINKVFEPTIILKSIEQNPSLVQPPPKITFSKINPTKYKVKVEGATNPYFLVFSESFHKGWKAYINKTQNLPVGRQDSKPLLANENNIVASYFNGEIKEEMGANQFISADTLKTWTLTSLPEEKHLKVNGYANSWYIEPKDSNGEENYEIIIEFWAQRLFYIGIAITLFVFLISFGYLSHGFLRSRKARP